MPVWFVDNSQDNFRIFRQPTYNTPGSAYLQIDSAGQVGIGEPNPAAALHITGPSSAPPTALNASDNGLLLGSNGTGGYKWIQSYGGPLVLNPVGNNNVGIGEDNPAAALHITGPSSAPPTALNASDNGLLLGSNGTGGYKWIQSYGGPLVLNPIGNNNVGIGEDNPAAALHITGPSNAPPTALNASDNGLLLGTSGPSSYKWIQSYGGPLVLNPTGNDVSIGPSGQPWFTVNGSSGLVSVATDIVLTGADCAEQFDVSGPALPEPGTVLVIEKEGLLRESSEAYDKKVAGVVSGAGKYRHGILLDGSASDEPRVPLLLLTGKVYCKVDAQYSPVEVGDLLTTSPTPGHAMKATEAAKAFGAVIGKALQALEVGQGLVPILVSLQ